jgi:hypothetical protein
MTGLRIKEFQRLVEETKVDWTGLKQMRTRPESDLKRRRGAGRKETFSTCEQQLFIVLFWMRSYSTLLMLEILFEGDEVTHWRTLHRVTPLLSARRLSVSQTGRRRIRNMEELKEAFPDIHAAIEEMLVDGTEQRIQRPKNKRKNKQYRSGKKKAHTVKTQVIVDARSKRILHVSKTVEGKKHDFRLFKETVCPTATDGGHVLLADSGYQGLQDQFPNLSSAKVVKKRFRGAPPLTRQERKQNRLLSKTRIFVEHAIGRLKQYKVLDHVFRHRLNRYNPIFRAVASITNLKLEMRAQAA